MVKQNISLFQKVAHHAPHLKQQYPFPYLADILEGMYAQIHKDHSRLVGHHRKPEIWAETGAANLIYLHLKER